MAPPIVSVRGCSRAKTESSVHREKKKRKEERCARGSNEGDTGKSNGEEGRVSGREKDEKRCLGGKERRGPYIAIAGRA